MKSFPVCPVCGSPSVKVAAKTVKKITGSHKGPKKGSADDWYACIDRDCQYAFFSRNVSFKVSDLKVRLFYKDGSDNVPICYCAGITRGEIKEAVKKDCTSIGQVHKFTGKHKTGDCIKKNPLGKCCHQVFKWEINTFTKGNSDKG